MTGGVPSLESEPKPAALEPEEPEAGLPAA